MAPSFLASFVDHLQTWEDWTSRRFGRAVGIWDSQEALRARARRRAQGSWVSESKMSLGDLDDLDGTGCW